MHSSLWSTQGCLVLYSLLFMYVCSVYVCMWYIYHGQYRAFVPGYQDSQTPRQGPGSIEERNKIKETKSKKQNQRNKIKEKTMPTAFTLVVTRLVQKITIKSTITCDAVEGRATLQRHIHGVSSFESADSLI